MEMSSVLVGCNISPDSISITFAHYISSVITLDAILMGSTPDLSCIFQVREQRLCFLLWVPKRFAKWVPGALLFKLLNALCHLKGKGVINAIDFISMY